MGKAGKARKRRRIATELESAMGAAEASDEESVSGGEEERGPQQAGEKARAAGADAARALVVLEVLAAHLDTFYAKPSKPLRVALAPLLLAQRHAHFEPAPPPRVRDAAEVASILSPTGPHVASLLRVAAHFASGAEALSDPSHKGLRRALHPLVLEQVRRGGGACGGGAKEGGRASLSGATSNAFRHGDWARALVLLRRMAAEGEVPKLGAMQRWVRDCDLAANAAPAGPEGGGGEAAGGAHPDSVDDLLEGEEGEEDDDDGPRAAQLVDASGPSYSSAQGPLVDAGTNTALLLLDAVIRAGGDTLVAGGRGGGGSHARGTPSSAPSSSSSPVPSSLGLSQRAVVRRVPLFTTAAARGGDAHAPPTAHSTADVLAACPPPSHWSLADALKGVRVLSHIPGPQRRPPSSDDLNVYVTAPGSVVFEHDGHRAHSAARHDVPGVPGAFLMPDVLSPPECGQLLHLAEGIGYTRDGIDGIGALVWLADESLTEPLFQRVRGLLPQSIAQCALKGINARWRLFRYQPGAVYRPHIDGAWPGSGVDGEGRLTDDAFPGQRVSRLTFLVYLNGGFGGGATTFFLPGPEGVGHIDAVGVQPSAGSVLCFPHGDALGSLVHEGSEVAPGGVKYIIRSDVLYTVDPVVADVASRPLNERGCS